jgi:mono/diheme cytochrome c family protein
MRGAPGTRGLAWCCAVLVGAGGVLAGVARGADSPPAAQQRGRQVFEHWCAPCHAPVSGNERLPGTSTLQSIYQGTKPAALEQRTDLTAAMVAFYVRHGDNAMPWFRRTEISDADLAALAAYLSRNNTGHPATPANAPPP